MKKSVLLMALLVLAAPFAGMAAEIIFSGQSNDQFDLYKADLSNNQVTRLTNTEADELMPCVSPDRRRVVFVSDRQGANSLYLLSLDNAQQVDYVSVGAGAYANPQFTPDGSKILAKYAPDPEAPFANTQIVELDLQAKKQRVLIDSKKLAVPSSSETVAVVDRPLQVSENLLVYILAELADEISGRTTRSTLYMYDLKNGKHIRMGGGESYFTESGRPMGFKATMPTLIEESESRKYVAFAAIRGNIEREPMQVSLTGSGKGGVALNDANYFGPLLFADNTWIYGTMDEKSVTGIAYKSAALDARPQQLKFEGSIIYPSLLKP